MTTPNPERAKPLAEVSHQRARLLKSQAAAAELKEARLRGELVPAAEVEAAWSSVLREIRAGMLAIPSRVGQRLPHLRPDEISIIATEIRAVLAEPGGD